jgi:hypothetical protein
MTLVALPFLAIGCTSTTTVSEDVTSGVHKLKLKAGDTVKVVTTNRERFFLKITFIQQDGFKGTTLEWEGATAALDDMVYIDYSNLALIQEEHFSVGATAGAVATVTLIGAMVAAVSVGVAPAVMGPPP